MNNIHMNRGQAGFTLVELAIVMIIIGLLIGGILKGQELIANAQVTATVSQVKGIDAALSTFKICMTLYLEICYTNYRLPNCTAAPCTQLATAMPALNPPSVQMALLYEDCRFFVIWRQPI